jgi:Polyketide cyclase / dehydrase and lipid transport
MNHYTVTRTFGAPPEEVFAYLADLAKLPEWATEFARELKIVDGRYKVVNGLGEFYFEIRADAETGVIDMLAGADRGRTHLLSHESRHHSRRRKRVHLLDVPGAGPEPRAVREPVCLVATRVREPRPALQSQALT